MISGKLFVTGIQFTDTLQGFSGDIGGRSCMHIVDFSPGMSHTRGFRYSARFV